jgi:hypothetical protein
MERTDGIFEKLFLNLLDSITSKLNSLSPPFYGVKTNLISHQAK